MTRVARWIGLSLLVMLSACSPAPSPTPPVRQDVLVLAAASLSEAFRQIGQEFEAQNPAAHMVFNFAGSQQLAQQLAQGAPADVFASANDSQMQVAIDAGRVAKGAPRTFVTNRLTVIASTQAATPLASPSDLARPGLKVVLAASDVPAGQYALGFLDRASTPEAYGTDYRDAVLKNVVSYEENVRSVLAKVALGEADVGIVYVTDVAGENADKVTRLAIPDDLNVIAQYPIAAVSDSRQPQMAKAFVDWVLSARGQAVLAKYGFGAPQP